MNKPQSKDIVKKKKMESLPADKRRSTAKYSMPIVSEASHFWTSNEHSNMDKPAVAHPEIRVISPLEFQSNRGKIFEEARDGDAIFVVKRQNQYMAIICGYDPDTLAKISGADMQEVELDKDPLQQRVSIAEMIEYVKQRKSQWYSPLSP